MKEFQMLDWVRLRRWLVAILPLVYVANATAKVQAAPPSFAQICKDVQPKIVKIFGAGGYRGLEPYQSGFLISADGHVLTAWSYVLDTEVITVVLDDGRKYNGKLVGADPR